MGLCNTEKGGWGGGGVGRAECPKSPCSSQRLTKRLELEKTWRDPVMLFQQVRKWPQERVGQVCSCTMAFFNLEDTGGHGLEKRPLRGCIWFPSPQGFPLPASPGKGSYESAPEAEGQRQRQPTAHCLLFHPIHLQR